MKPIHLALLAAALLTVPALGHSAKRRVQARAVNTTVVFPVLRLFAAVRADATSRGISIKAAPGKPAKSVTVRAHRVSTGQIVFNKTATVSTTSAIKFSLPAHSGANADKNDVQSLADQYIIQVTPGGKSAALGNTNILGRGIEACRGTHVKWFEGKDSVTSTGKGQAVRPEPDPWPDPDGTNPACRS